MSFLSNWKEGSMSHYKVVDMNTYNRKTHFEYFNKMDYPFVGFTANVDVTNLLNFCKKNHLSFYFSCVYAIINAVNKVPQLRQRIIDHNIVEYPSCIASTTEGKEDGTYVYCNYENKDNYYEFLDSAKTIRDKALSLNGLTETGDIHEMVFMSCIPWISFTDFVQPLSKENSSIPHITWGKYFNSEGKVLMPVSSLCHHGLVDGIHLGKFYQELQIEIDRIWKQ